MKILFKENRLIYLKGAPSKGPDAAKTAPALREKDDPTHKAEQAQDKIARLTKVIDDLQKNPSTMKHVREKMKNLHAKLVNINDRLNKSFEKQDKQQERVISSTLTELNGVISGNADLNRLRKEGINSHKDKMVSLMKVKGNQNYQEVFEHMTGMFSLMNEGEAIDVNGATFTKNGTDLNLKLGKQKHAYSFYIVSGQWRIVNKTRKREVKSMKYTAQNTEEIKSISALANAKDTGSEGYAYGEKTGKLTKEATKRPKEVPNAVKKYVASVKEGVKTNLKTMRYMNPPNQFIRDYVAAVDPKNPDKGVKKMTALRNRLQEYGKKLDSSINYDTAKKFEENVVKGLIKIISENTPNTDLANRVVDKFPKTETKPLLASYNKMQKGPAQKTDVAGTGPASKAEKTQTAPKFGSIIRKGAEKYISKSKDGNDFVLKGVTHKKIHQILGTPKDKYVSITVTRKNGEKVTGAYLPDSQKTYTDADGRRVRIYDGDSVHINRVSTWTNEKRKKTPRKRRKITRRPRATARKRTPEKKNKKETTVYKKSTKGQAELNRYDEAKDKKVFAQKNIVRDLVRKAGDRRDVNCGSTRTRETSKFVYKTSLFGHLNGRDSADGGGVVGVVTIDGRGGETRIRINYSPAYSKLTGKKGTVHLSYRNKNQVYATISSMFKKLPPQKVPKDYVKVTKLNKKDIAT